MVSIVIPSYNQQDFLNDAIDSALAQGVTEVIVVDDGSTDNSLEIAKSYKNVKVISQVNKGLPSARNTGIMNASSDFILFLDADDMLLDGAIEKLLIKMQETNADVVHPSFKCFGTNQGEVILMENPQIEDFMVANRVGYCGLFKKSVLLELGGYSPKMRFGYEDYHLSFNMLSRGKKIATTQEILWLYRTKENSMIHDAQSHHEELMEQINKDFNLWKK